jgi:hypothetical protein
VSLVAASWAEYLGWSSAQEGHAEFDRRDAGEAFGLLPFLPQIGEGEIDALDLTEPVFALSACATDQQVFLISSNRGSIFGFMASIGQRKQECLCWQGEPYGRVQPPSSTFRQRAAVAKSQVPQVLRDIDDLIACAPSLDC